MKAEQNNPQNIFPRKKILFALFVIIALGAMLRFYDLGANSFVADEFLDINATYGYSQTTEHRSWDFNRGEITKRQNVLSDERAWLYREQVATLFNILPPTEFVARSVSALWGIIGIIIIYFVTFSLTRNRGIALLAAFLLAVSVPTIEMDRKIRMYAMFAPVFLLFSWSLFRFLETGHVRIVKNTKASLSTITQNIFACNYLYLVPTVLLGIIAFHLHPLTANITFVLFVYFLAMGLSGGMKNHSFFAPSHLRYSIYALAMIIGVLAVKVIFPERWLWFMSTLTFFEDHWSYIGHIARNYWHPLLGGLLIITGAWQLLQHCNDLRKKAGLWIICNFTILLLAAIFLWERNVGPQYILFAQSFGLILAAAGMYGAIAWVRKNTLSQKIFFGSILLVILLVPNYAYFLQRNNTYHLKADGETPNYREVFVFVRKQFSAGDALITRNFRSYYFNGFDAVVYDFGSDRSEDALVKEGKVKKMTLIRAQEIIAQHPSGWIVYSDNDEKFLEKELREYLESGVDERITKINHTVVRGKISVYQWGDDSL